jgi:hypothetical protein
MAARLGLEGSTVIVQDAEGFNAQTEQDGNLVRA